MMFIYWVKNINAIKKKTEAVSEVRMEGDPEVNAEKTKYMVVSHCQKA
jgi:hypothetical protein